MRWNEWQCHSLPRGCPCSYPTQPLLRLRGLCKESLIEKDSTGKFFSLRQPPHNPDNIILLGQWTAKIEFNETSSQWILIDAKKDVTAVSRATKLSYLLGKHEWTISEDDNCGKGRPYKTFLKLTGCAEDEFTCNDGQCIKMGRRCDQVTITSVILFEKHFNCPVDILLIFEEKNLDDKEV